MSKITILDLLDVIHFTIIKNKGENDIILEEVQRIEAKIKALKTLENYSVEDTQQWKDLFKNK